MISPPAAPDRDNRALEAFKLLKEWITWLVAIETASIGGIVVGLKDGGFAGACRFRLPWSSILTYSCERLAQWLATGVVIAFSVAILTALYLLLSLPALVERMQHAGQDLYSMPTAAGFRLPLYWYVRVLRWSSLWGFLLLAGLIVLLIWSR